MFVTDAVTVILLDKVVFDPGVVIVTDGVPVVPPVLLSPEISATVSARLYKRTSSILPTHPPYCPPKYRAT
jgi:hypothetical protein